MLYFIFLFLYYGNSQWGWYECRRMLQSTIVDVSPLNFVNQHFAPTSKDETDQNIKGANQEITQYTLTAFSLTQLLIDLRHLYKQNDSNNIEQLNYTATDWGINITLNQTQVSLPAIFDQTNVEMVSSFKLIIFSFYTLLLQIRIDINTKDLYSQKYQFMNTTKVYNTQPSTARANTTSIFVFGIFETDQIQLPANILPLNQNDYYNYIISYTSDNYFQQNTYTTYSPASKYWGQRSSVAVPYIPFFSNCQGFGQYVYFYQLIEHENCTLYKVSETEAINPFSFGMSPRSDECVGLSLYCIMDEKYNDNPRLSRWFELNTQATMFQIQANPMAPEQFGDELTDLVSIQTTNSIPSGMMPLEVNLEIQYYQVTPQDKRIITGSVTFTNFYKLSDDQKAGKSQIVYNLIVSFISMTQGQLVNNFALEWPVYFILYSIIGAILTLEVATFFLYHYIANRRRPRPKVKFVAYLKSKFQYDSFAGCLLAFFPGMAVYVLISVIMSGQIWSNDVSLSCNFTPSSDTDSGCAMVLFDLFKNQLKYTDSAFTNLRNARCGISFITVGIYMAYYISGIYIPDNKKENIEYNGNVMNVRLWKRSRILYCLLFITTLILLLTEFSFSNLFQNNAYVFLILLKVMQMMLETILEFFFDNNLISSPIGIILSTYINVATMGNPTFYAFLLSTFVDKGIEMCERAYIIKIQDFVIDQLEEQYEKVFKLLKRLLDEEEENFELEDEKLMETQKVLKTNEDDSDSDIVFSDDGKENLASDDESVVSNKISSNNQENSFTKDEQDEFESKFRTHLLDQHHKQFQQFNEEQGTLQELPADESDQTDLIDYFTNFANDIVTIVFYPFIIVAFWMFYNQSTLLSNYQINESQFIYYFLWAIMLIPFQVLIDIFGYNLVEQYHELDFLTYIRNTRERFRNRTLFWKANEIQNDLKCETCFKSLDCKYLNIFRMVLFFIILFYYNFISECYLNDYFWISNYI